jgi:hypothetical protein
MYIEINIEENEVYWIERIRKIMAKAKDDGNLVVAYSENTIGKDGHHEVEVTTPDLRMSVTRTDYLAFYNYIKPISR